MKPKHVGLAFELDDLCKSLEGVHLLVQELSTGHLPNSERSRRAPFLIEALTGLILVRLQQVTRVAYGNADAASIWTPLNDASEQLEGEVRQLILTTGLRKR